MNRQQIKMIGNIAMVKDSIKKVLGFGGKVNLKALETEIMAKRYVTERKAKEYIRIALFQLKLKKDEIEAR